MSHLLRFAPIIEFALDEYLFSTKDVESDYNKSSTIFGTIYISFEILVTVARNQVDQEASQDQACKEKGKFLFNYEDVLYEKDEVCKFIDI